MSNNKKIHISADCVSDAKSKMGGNFKSCICGLLDEEYLVEIEITSGTFMLIATLARYSRSS